MAKKPWSWHWSREAYEEACKRRHWWMRPRPYREYHQMTPSDILFAIGGLLFYIVLVVMVPPGIAPFVLWGSVLVALVGSLTVMTRREMKRLQREREKNESAHREGNDT
jgi:hypothetical protein